MRGVPWSKLLLSVLAAGLFWFFWTNGPLQERPPVFEFKEEMSGFDEPVRFGEEQATRVAGVVGALETHPNYRIIPARDDPPRTHGIIGDARTNPGVREETGQLILARARERAAYPDGVSLRRALDMYYAEARDPAGRLVELHLENTGLNRNVKGYAGPIDLHLVVGMDGRIRSLSHVKSAETTSYLNRIRNAGFYELFEGIPLDGNSYRVDLVSGASLTTEGIARSVTQLVGIARESPLESYMDTHAQGFDVRAVLPRTWIVETLLIVALFVVVWLRRLRRTGPLMLVVGIASLLFLGFYMNNSFTYVTFTQPFLGVRWSWLLGVYAGLVLVSAIWDGNSYCRYVCPYGNAQRLLLRFMPWRGRLAIPNRVLGGLRWLITLCLFAGIVAGLQDWGSFELFPDLFGLEFIGSPWFWLSLGLVLVSAYYPMLWCRALCPTGAVLDGLTFLARPRGLPAPARS